MNGVIGQPLPRKEDFRLLTGNGRYTDDINLEGQVYAYFVRSPHAHAQLGAIDTSAAAALPGVLSVMTGEDYQADGMAAQGRVAAIPTDILQPDKPGLVPRPGTQALATPYFPLAVGKVRRVGECVAVCIAETPDRAKDGAELVKIDYQALPPVVDLEAAVADDAPQLWEHAPGNVVLEVELGDKPATDRAFAGAAHVVKLKLANNRVAPVTMEPRGQLAAYDAAKDRFTLYVGNQRTVLTKQMMARFLKVDAQSVHILSGDVGGSYGMRGGGYPEYLVGAWLARRLGRPIKWICERSEAMLSDSQARELVTWAELALAGDGKFLGLRIEHLYATGATAGAYAPLSNGVRLVTGNYAIPTAHLLARAVTTNTLPTSVYRGAGRPEAIFNLERLIDRAAAKMGLDRIAIRRANLIQTDQLPYTNPMGIPYDSGEFEAIMDRALGLADWQGFEARRAVSRRAGKLRGIGLTNYIQTPTGALKEWTSVHVRAEGAVEVRVGTDSSGQGHETSFAQVVAEWLGVPLRDVHIIEGDTDLMADGGGSHSDRSMRLAGAIMVEAADKVIDKGKRIAAHILETAIPDIEFDRGTYRVKGTDRAIGLFEVASRAVGSGLPEDLRGPLREEADIARRLPAYPNGCAVCEVEIDPDTGAVGIERFASVDDVGRAINPMIVHGQTAGGIAQGVGQALLEEVIYDPASGQLLSGSFMDYAMPRADDLPAFALALHEVPAPSNRLGVKGGGEGGTVSAPAAVINAIHHALGELGVNEVPMPATPERVWRAIQARAFSDQI